MSNKDSHLGDIEVRIVPVVFDRKQLAAHMGVSVPTIRRWEKEGRCPAGFKVGGKKFFRRVHVETWLDALSEEQRDLGQLDQTSAHAV